MVLLMACVTEDRTAADDAVTTTAAGNYKGTTNCRESMVSMAATSAM